MTLHLPSPLQGGPLGQATTPTTDEPAQKHADGPWGEMENEVLRGAIEHFQGHPIRTDMHSSAKDKDKCLKWSLIAARCEALGCRRSAKQCRERYINHMAPGRRDKIGPDEGRHIVDLVAEHGQKWAWIGRELNRPENTVKNYWNQERKKRENGKKRASSHSHAAPSGRQQSARTYYYPPPSREHPHSRRESLSSNPGLVSDHGSPVESSPRSSRHNSYDPSQQLPLPPFHGWKPDPASPLQPGYQMDRKQSLSASSIYSTGLSQFQDASPTQEHFHQRAHPMAPHHPEGLGGHVDRRGQAQQQYSINTRHTRADSGFEQPSYAVGYSHGRTIPASNTAVAQPSRPVHNQTDRVPFAEVYRQQAHCETWGCGPQAREHDHESRAAQDSPFYRRTAPQQSPAAAPMNLPYRTPHESLPPVSTVLHPFADVHHSSQHPAAGATSNKPRSTRGSLEEMDLRRILN